MDTLTSPSANFERFRGARRRYPLTTAFPRMPCRIFRPDFSANCQTCACSSSHTSASGNRNRTATPVGPKETKISLPPRTYCIPSFKPRSSSPLFDLYFSSAVLPSEPLLLFSGSVKGGSAQLCSESSSGFP